jgi:hypothetical protein
MDISELLASGELSSGDRVELSGWIVDTNDGLYILGDHYPENYEHSCRVHVENGNIMYPILAKVPSLGGGRSLIFYRAKITGVLQRRSPSLVRVEQVSIEADRESGRYIDIDINPAAVAEYVERNGDYKFLRPRDPMCDWLDK